jgi:Flp pilus assembly pilin Flp
MLLQLAKKARKFLVEEVGVVMSEYAMLLGLVALALFAAVGALATALSNRFSSAAQTLQK